MNIALSLLIHGEAVRFNRSRGDKPYDFKYMEGGPYPLPYVSAQCYKKHWREALPQPWSPIIIPQKKGAKVKDANQGYTAGDPIQYLDDDLFGYMIAGAEEVQEEEEESNIDFPDEEEAAIANGKSGKKAEAEKRETTRRTAPIRMHAPVAFCGVRIAKDFQTLARHLAYSGGNAVLNPNPPSFYTGWLRTRIIIEAERVGRFFIGKNLDILDNQVRNLPVMEQRDPYSKEGSMTRFVELPLAERRLRVRLALEALANIGNNRGPSSSALHDGSLRPKAFVGAFMQCADSPFDAVWEAETERPRLNTATLKATLRDNDDLFASHKVYIGLPVDEEPEYEAMLREALDSISDFEFEIGTVRRTLLAFAAASADM